LKSLQVRSARSKHALQAMRFFVTSSCTCSESRKWLDSCALRACRVDRQLLKGGDDVELSPALERQLQKATPHSLQFYVLHHDDVFCGSLSALDVGKQLKNGMQSYLLSLFMPHLPAQAGAVRVSYYEELGAYW
jgi:hypothetical protein